MKLDIIDGCHLLSHKEVERIFDRVLIASSAVSLIEDIKHALKPEIIRARGRLTRAYVEEHFHRVYNVLANYFGRREH